MLNSMPHIDANKSQLSINSWKKLKPLSLEEIMKNSIDEIEIDRPEIDFKEVKFENHRAIGLFNRNTNTIDGIARRIFSHT